MKLINNSTDFNLNKNILLGIAQILLWGGSFFILSIIADPIAKEMNWSQTLIYGCLSLSLLISGLAAPLVGKHINKKNNCPIILYAGIVMGIGLAIIAGSSHFLLFILGWTIVGISMAMGLYDALFAILGKKLGNKAGKSIVQITLISGFAPTVSWPLVSWLVNLLGWREACFLYAFLLMILVYPIHFYVFKNDARKTAKNDSLESLSKMSENAPGFKVFNLLLIHFTIGSILMTGISVHLIAILVNNKMTDAAAVSIAALIGPSQVGVRVLDLILPKKDPITTGAYSSIAILAGLFILFFDSKLAFIGVLVYGMGNGMRSILRGTLPLWIYGSADYAAIMGKLARFPLIAQAITPLLGGWIINYFGSESFLKVLSILALINIIIMVIIQKKISKKQEPIPAVQ